MTKNKGENRMSDSSDFPEKENFLEHGNTDRGVQRHPAKLVPMPEEISSAVPSAFARRLHYFNSFDIRHRIGEILLRKLQIATEKFQIATKLPRIFTYVQVDLSDSRKHDRRSCWSTNFSRLWHLSLPNDGDALLKGSHLFMMFTRLSNVREQSKLSDNLCHFYTSEYEWYFGTKWKLRTDRTKCVAA